MKKSSINILLIILAIIVFILFNFIAFTYFYNRWSLKMQLPGNLNSIVGGNLALPDKYSQLLPIYPGSRIFSVIEGSGNVTVGTRVSDNIDTAIAWHKAEITKMRYSIDQFSTHDEVTNIWFHNDMYKGSVTLSNKDYAHPGQTTTEVRVSLWLEKKTSE